MMVIIRELPTHPLSKAGWQQLYRAVAEKHDWDAIISSPLCRCREFAREFSLHQGIPLEIVADLREINFGDWEGKTAEQITREDPDGLMRFYRDPADNPPPNGEDLRGFYRRTTSALQTILQNHRGKHLLLTTHAGVIRMLFVHLLGIPLQNSYNIQIPHAGLSRFQCFHTETADIQKQPILRNWFFLTRRPDPADSTPKRNSNTLKTPVFLARRSRNQRRDPIIPAVIFFMIFMSFMVIFFHHEGHEGAAVITSCLYIEIIPQKKPMKSGQKPLLDCRLCKISITTFFLSQTA